MNQDGVKKLAIECGAIGGATCVFYLYELEAYTAAVEAPLQAELDNANQRIAQLEEALKADCGDRCNAEYNPCAARQVLSEPPSTWLSEHDKEVEARVIERCAKICTESSADDWGTLSYVAERIRNLP